MKISYIIPTNTIDKEYTFIAFDENQKNNRLTIENNTQKLIMGIEKRSEMTRRKLFILARKVIATAKQHKIKKLVIPFSEFDFSKLKIQPQDLSELLTTNFEMANFEFNQYKTKPEEGWDLIEEIIFLGPKNIKIQKGIERGQIIAKEINGCRISSNTPGKDMTPSVLADSAKDAAKGFGIKIKILEAEDMEKLGMGGILGVSQGSIEKPKFIILEYRGKASGKPIVFIGKGVTFDSGGINIKPSDGMSDMHMDMSGGAAVIHTLCAIAKLKMKKNVIGIIPAVENMPSGTSMRPGDILKTMSGKTIEVLNTDAEGRIILADALTYSERYEPKLVVDVATLTGAAIVALGQRATALFTKDENLVQVFKRAGEEVGEYVWPMPLWDEYEEDIKGTFGYLANISKTRYGGAITGAMFLYQFAKNFPWVHLDIAPRMTAIEGEYLAKGAIGTPVRLLIKIAEKI